MCRTIPSIRVILERQGIQDLGEPSELWEPGGTGVVGAMWAGGGTAAGGGMGAAGGTVRHMPSIIIQSLY